MKRRGMYALIHKIKAQLQMTNESYRAILQEKWGVDSSAALSDENLLAFTEHMKHLARLYRLDLKLFSSPRANSAKKEGTPQQRKVKVMWTKLVAKEIPLPTTSLNGYVKNEFGIECLEWLDKMQLSRLINDLQNKAVKYNVLEITQYDK